MQHGEQDRSRKLRKEHCKDVRQTERRKQRKTDRGYIEPKRAGSVKKQEQNHGEQRKKGAIGEKRRRQRSEKDGDTTPSSVAEQGHVADKKEEGKKGSWMKRR